MTLSKIIRHNTGFDNCPENVFFASQNCIGVKDFQCIARPADRTNFKVQYDEMKKEKERMENITQILIIAAAVLGGLTLCLALVAVILMCRKRQTSSKMGKGDIDDVQSGSKFDLKTWIMAGFSVLSFWRMLFLKLFVILKKVDSRHFLSCHFVMQHSFIVQQITVTRLYLKTMYLW